MHVKPFFWGHWLFRVCPNCVSEKIVFYFHLSTLKKSSPKTASGTILLLVTNNHIDFIHYIIFFGSFTIIASTPTASAKIAKSAMFIEKQTLKCCNFQVFWARGIKFYGRIMHIKVFQKNEKKFFEGGPKKFWKKKFLDPAPKIFFLKGKKSNCICAKSQQNPSSGSEITADWNCSKLKFSKSCTAAGGWTGETRATKFWLKKLRGGIKHTFLSKIF